ncbi:MAG: DUF58 domain-containing protein [Proteobacteria bacterium]|nr:DUF58 domain-containing protein [Pseudomonadota bacterium]
MTGYARQRLIDPKVLGALQNLELIARTAVEGALIGLHRSNTFGFSPEFAEYRAYVPGDDLRHIDWNVFARTDRTYIKRFFGDTNCQLIVLLDTSASMGVGDPALGLTKHDYARFIAAALVYLAARQHDAIGILGFNDQTSLYRPAQTHAASTRRLYHDLDELKPGGGTDWHHALTQLQGLATKRSLLVLISDFYTDIDDLGNVLRGFAAQGHDLLVIHLLHPGEKEVSLQTGSTLKDVETGQLMAVSSDELRSDYKTRLEEHVHSLMRSTRGMGGHFMSLGTDQPLDLMLSEYLRFRARHP